MGFTAIFRLHRPVPGNAGQIGRRRQSRCAGWRSVAVPQRSIADNARLATLTRSIGALIPKWHRGRRERRSGMRARSSKGNVFVGNLPPDFSDERLAEAFDPYGIVLSAVVARDPSNGARLRYGFVDIATDRAAAKAITALDGSEIDGCKLNVKAREKREKKPGTGGPPRRQGFRAAPPPP